MYSQLNNNNSNNLSSLPRNPSPQHGNSLSSNQRAMTTLNASANTINNTSTINPANSSFKEQRKSYDLTKRHFSKHVQVAIENTQEVHSGWLKARTAFKHWTKVWCQVKPSYLVMYTSQEAQKKHRLGVVILSVCQLIIRPTKKEGFCFKLINPLGVSIWAKSSTRALAFSQSSLTLRASDLSIGKVWLDALNQCNLSSNIDAHQGTSSENMQCNRSEISDSDDGDISTRQLESLMLSQCNNINASNNFSTSSIINNQSSASGPLLNGNSIHSNARSSKSIMDSRADGNKDQNGIFQERTSSQLGKNSPITNLPSGRMTNDCLRGRQIQPSADYESAKECLSMNSTKMSTSNKYKWTELQLEGVNYIIDGLEELGSAGIQSEEVHDSNKNFLWHIIKQLRPGMDLSKVTLPTFILEPRSFLEKLADYYYHCDILSEAVLINDPVIRLVNIVKWYLSGFYKKPKGPKKPYNPILGERFRCFWDHPKTQSRTFFVAEQVSHHPPISAFHVSNRKDGYTITCALLSRSKFGGNSVSAILDGKAKLHLNNRNETYTLTMPYANCRGILLGSLCLELGGKVEIECAETGCRCELDFKLAPVWANSNSYNALTGKILRANKITHTLEGHWDKRINITDKRTDEKSVLWEVTDTIRNARLKRYTVAVKDQGERESVRLWSKVTEALQATDQTLATVEKTRLEDMQRQEARERRGTFNPEHFVHRSETNDWYYRWLDNRSWDERRDVLQFEDNFRIRTLMMKNTNLQGGSSSEAARSFDPNIDLPLAQLSIYTKSNGQLELSAGNHSLALVQGTDVEQQSNPDAFSSIQSKFDAENLLIKQAIQQVTEKNQKLEEDLATLKRSKRAGAIFIATIIIAILSMLFRYLS